jgi:HD-GYP domain-containing protein (c-di-GMP phosphodiesterase class II)
MRVLDGPKEQIKKIRQNAEVLRISQEARERFGDWLEILRKHDFKTYCHSLRTGLTGLEVARFLRLDPKPLFYAGLFHDFGKIKVNSEVLRKTRGFSEEDYKEIKKHPLVGYFILKKVFPFSAEILLRHHRFQEIPYPENLPDNQYTPKERVLIEQYARLLALVDFYDALASRENKRFGEITDREKLQEVLIEHNPDMEVLIKELFLQGIF